MRYLFVAALLASCIGLSSASEDPVPPPPEVATLVLSKDAPNGNLVLNWSDGAALFSVQRSESPVFSGSPTLTYVSRSTTSSPVTDHVLTDGKIYYYLVSDSNAPAAIYTLTTPTATAYERQTMSIDGVGFSSICADDKVLFEGGEEAVLLS